MIANDVVVGFAHLFYGRHDAYFLSYPDKGGRTVWSPVHLGHFRGHLLGTREIGTYPVTDDGQCRWGCIDIDDDDFTKAKAAWLVWNHYGISAWIERSRSKGWHIWTFAKDWIPATVMREAGEWVCTVAELGKQEINPKNDAPWKTKNGLVNTVRLPYSGKANPGRMTVVNETTLDPISVGEWVELANRSSNSKDAIAHLQQDYIKSRSVQANASSHSHSDATVRPIGSARSLTNGSGNQEAAQILAGNRIAQVGERDNQLYTIANYLRAQGYSYRAAIQAMTRVWDHYLEDKYSYDLQEALSKVDRAFNG